MTPPDTDSGRKNPRMLGSGGPNALAVSDLKRPPDLGPQAKRSQATDHDNPPRRPCRRIKIPANTISSDPGDGTNPSVLNKAPQAR